MRTQSKVGIFLGTTIGLLLLLYAIILIGAQCLYWLKVGVWVSISLYDVFIPHALRGQAQPFVLNLVPEVYDRGLQEYLEGYMTQSWIGLRRIIVWVLKFLPLSLTAIGLSGWSLFAAASEAEIKAKTE